MVEKHKEETSLVEQGPKIFEPMDPNNLAKRFPQQDISHMILSAHDCREPSILAEMNESFNLMLKFCTQIVGIVAGGGALEDQGR